MEFGRSRSSSNSRRLLQIVGVSVAVLLLFTILRQSGDTSPQPSSSFHTQGDQQNREQPDPTEDNSNNNHNHNENTKTQNNNNNNVPPPPHRPPPSFKQPLSCTSSTSSPPPPPLEPRSPRPKPPSAPAGGDVYLVSRTPKTFTCAPLFPRGEDSNNNNNYQDAAKEVLFGERSPRRVDVSRVLCSLAPLQPLHHWSVVIGAPMPQWIHQQILSNNQNNNNTNELVSRYIEAASPLDDGLLVSNFGSMNLSILYPAEQQCLVDMMSSSWSALSSNPLRRVSVASPEELFSPSPAVIETLFGDVRNPELKELDLLMINTQARQCQTLDHLLKFVVPKLIVVSFNPLYPPPMEFTSSHYRSSEEGSQQQLLLEGCSLAAVSSLARSYGYELLQVDYWQAYFIQKEATHIFGDIPHDDAPLWLSGYYLREFTQKLRDQSTFNQPALWQPQVQRYHSLSDVDQLLKEVEGDVQQAIQDLRIDPKPSVSLQITDSASFDARYRNRPNQRKMFLYLVQNPGLIRDDRIIADRYLITPNSDRISLTYREEVKREGYYHFPGSTWTTGRNKLHQLALEKEQKQGWKYLYWIFLDYDVDLFVREHRYPNSNTWIEPWRLFESYLLEYEPAIGLPYYLYGTEAATATPTLLDSRPVYEAQGRYQFDAIINAIHREAADNLLPYTSDFDHISWWYSQLMLIYKAYYLYHDHIQEYPRIMVFNPEHNPYPRGKDWDETVPKLLKLFPSERNAACFLTFWEIVNPGHGTLRPKTRPYNTYTFTNAPACISKP